jgi:LysM repeat protein
MMDRKKTIMIAALINAGLLAALFIAALTTKEEDLVQSDVGSHKVEMEQAPKPLFGEGSEFVSVAPPLSDIIQPIEIPELKQDPIIHALPAPVEVAAVAPPAPVAFEPQMAQVTVKKGDTLDKIAKSYKTSVEEILALNKLPSSFLKVGQVLKLPPEKGIAPRAKAAPVEKQSASSEFYTVKVGDNPWTIAMKHHIKVEELLRLNGLNEEKARKLKPGDRLRTK